MKSHMMLVECMCLSRFKGASAYVALCACTENKLDNLLLNLIVYRII
jgi:hypothetical protein